MKIRTLVSLMALLVAATTVTYAQGTVDTVVKQDSKGNVKQKDITAKDENGNVVQETTIRYTYYGSGSVRNNSTATHGVARVQIEIVNYDSDGKKLSRRTITFRYDKDGNLTDVEDKRSNLSNPSNPNIEKEEWERQDDGSWEMTEGTPGSASVPPQIEEFDECLPDEGSTDSIDIGLGTPFDAELWYDLRSFSTDDQRATIR